MQVCNAMCLCNPGCESCELRVLKTAALWHQAKCIKPCEFLCEMDHTWVSAKTFGLLRQVILAVRCALQKITFAMRCLFIALYTLAAEIHCDVGHDAGITAKVTPRYGGEFRPQAARLSLKTADWRSIVIRHSMAAYWQRGVRGECVCILKVALFISGPPPSTPTPPPWRSPLE